MPCTLLLCAIGLIGMWVAVNPWEGILSEKVLLEVLFLVGLVIKHLLDERNRRIDSRERQAIAAEVKTTQAEVQAAHAKLDTADVKQDANMVVSTAGATAALKTASALTGDPEHQVLADVLHQFDARQEAIMSTYREKTNAAAEDTSGASDAG